MDQYNLGKPIAGGGSGLVGHTVPMAGFDQGEHGAGTGVSGGVSQISLKADNSTSPPLQTRLEVTENSPTSITVSVGSTLPAVSPARPPSRTNSPVVTLLVLTLFLGLTREVEPGML